MTSHVPDDQIHQLLSDAVSDVDPAHRLDEIRARTTKPARRPRWYAVGGAVLATAAAVTAIAVVSDRQNPVDQPPSTPGATDAYALYFVGDTPAGPRLYREFQRLPEADGLQGVLEAITTARGPDDPDYSTIWAPGYFESATIADGAIEISLGPWTGPTYEIPPAAVRMSVQQVVYTAQAATGEDLPVRFVEDGRPVDEMLGVVSLRPDVARARELDTLALVSISDPAEGQVVSGTTLAARGRASSFEATVPWRIEDADGAVVEEGFATAEGWMDRLYPWETEVDVSRLEPGTYTFVASTSDPSGGAEGPGPTSDTRTIVVE